MFRMNRLLITSAVAGLAIVVVPPPPALGQASAAPGPAIARPASAPALSNAPPSYSSTRRLPDDLLNGDRRQTIVLPSEPRESDQIPEGSGGVVAKISPEIQRLPEGYVIGARPAQIKTEGGWQVASLAPREGVLETPPLRLLPNQYLEMIETVLTDAGASNQFLLTGRVTEFQGVNYLLVEHIAHLLPPSVAAAKPAPVKPAPDRVSSPEGSTADRPAPGSSSTPQATRRITDREPSAEEVIRQLMQTEPARALVLPQDRVGKPATSTMPAEESKLPANLFEPASAPTAPPAGGTAQAAPTRNESTWLIDQLGRVVPGGGVWWSLAFEDRGQQASRKPVRLLPNRLLETAIALSGGGTRGVVFSVSGETTTYRGQDYLLIRKVLVRRDMGNFR